MRSLTRAFLVLAFAAAALQACNTTGCLENRNAIPLAGFYSSDSVPKAITLDSVQVMGLGVRNDSLLVEAGTQVSTLYLPMRSTQLSTGWVFSYKWSYLDYTWLNDTIVFEYTSSPRFASEECGVIYDYHILKCTYTTHLIDSVRLTDSLITNIDQERIHIYFRTDED